MKSISLKVLCGLGLVFGLAFFGLVAESEAAASLQAAETTQPPSGDNWIVGMWRESHNVTLDTVACQIFYADGSVIAIGLSKRTFYSYNVMYNYTYTMIDVSRGKYRLTGNSLEIFDLSGFEMSSMSVLGSNSKLYAENLVKVRNMVNTGSRSEVEQLINPKNTLYVAYENDQWAKWGDRTNNINILDADCFITEWTFERAWKLSRVQE